MAKKIFVPIFWLIFAFEAIATAPPIYNGFEEINAEKTAFIILGDTQVTSHWEFWRERNPEQTKLLLKEIARRKPAFIINLGDLTTRGSSEKHWNNFDRSHQPIRQARIPCFPILGNHDYYGDNELAFKNYFSRFPYLEGRKWYTFIFRNIGFIMLDGNIPSLKREEIIEEREWYERQLQNMEQNSKIDFIVVCCHRPPFTNSKVVSRTEEVEEYFARPFMNSRKGSFFFSGHCHSYEKFFVGGKYFIVSGGAGGPRHKLETNPLKRKYNDRFPGEALRFFHFCEIEIKREGLNFRVIKLNEDASFAMADNVEIYK